MDAIDFPVGAEELDLPRSICPVDIVQNSEHRWQDNREMRIQSLGHDLFVYVARHMELICREMRSHPWIPRLY